MASQRFGLYLELMSAFAPYQARPTRPLNISFHINISVSGEAGLSLSLSLLLSFVLDWIYEILARFCRETKMNYSSNLSNCWDGSFNQPPSHKKSNMPTNQMDLKRYLFEFLPNRQDHIVEKKTPQRGWILGAVQFFCLGAYSIVQQLVFPRRLTITWITKLLEGFGTWIIKRTLCPRVGLPEDWI